MSSMEEYPKFINLITGLDLLHCVLLLLFCLTTTNRTWNSKVEETETNSLAVLLQWNVFCYREFVSVSSTLLLLVQLLKNFKHSRILGAFANFKKAIQTLLNNPYRIQYDIGECK